MMKSFTTGSKIRFYAINAIKTPAKISKKVSDSDINKVHNFSYGEILKQTLKLNTVSL